MTYKEVKIIDEEIRNLQSRLGRLEREVYSATPKLSDAPSGSGSGDKIGRAVAEIADLNTEIQALRFRRDSAVNKLDSRKFEENCLYMRLKYGMSWPQIAAKVSSTPGSIKMMCHRYIW